jgi:quinol-cytochrome oxidoreductase complex cytochrome b subunit
MSLWACTVITNLLSVIPFIGNSLVTWLWGNYFVSSLTLKLFMTLHLLIPILITLQLSNYSVHPFGFRRLFI